MLRRLGGQLWGRAFDMDRDEVQKIFEEVGAIRSGHFELTSGLHSGTYIQCAMVLQHPQHSEALGKALAEKFKDMQISCVVAPAMGGITIGYEVARALGVRSLWVERDKSGQMALRRGWEIKPGERVLVIEDVWTTGGSTKETIALVQQEGGLVVAAGALIDRTNGKLDLNVPAHALLSLQVPTYEPAACPLCKSGAAPAYKPGSRMTRAQSS
jgi:orotate phosphoribosyltransferase